MQLKRVVLIMVILGLSYQYVQAQNPSLDKWIYLPLIVKNIDSSASPSPTATKTAIVPVTVTPTPTLNTATPTATATHNPTLTSTVTTATPTATRMNCNQPLCAQPVISLLTLQNRSVQTNVLKLFSVAVDASRHRAFVSGILSSHIGVMDTTTFQWLQPIDAKLPASMHKYLFMDSAANYLYILVTTESAEGNTSIYRLDLHTQQVAGPLTITVHATQATVDSQRTMLYIVSKDSPSLQAISGKTMQVAYTYSQLAENTGDVAYDETSDLLYIMDSAVTGTQRSVYKFSPVTQAVSGTITYQVNTTVRSRAMVWDSQNRRLMVFAGTQTTIFNESGITLKTISMNNPLDFEDMVYDSVHDRLAVLYRERPANGEVAGKKGWLYIYNVATGQKVNQFSFGLKPHRPVLDSAHNMIFIPNADSGTVWRIPTESYNEVISMPLGESLEGVAPTDGAVYLNSRLGGSYLLAYTMTNGSYDAFTSGTWPIPIRTNQAKSRLFVLNAWDSTLAVYDLTANRKLLGTVPIGLAAGSTDRLPDLTIDSTRQLAFASYPEHGRVAVVDWAKLQAVTTISVTGFPAGDVGGGPGQLQVKVNEAQQRLFVYWGNQHRLNVYDGNYNALSSPDISKLKWSLLGENTTADTLFVDEAQNRLFIGPFELNGTTGTPTNRQLAQGQVIFALDTNNNVYWAWTIDNQKVILSALHRDSLALRYEETLPLTASMTPSFALHNGQIFVGYLNTVQLAIYTIGVLP